MSSTDTTDATTTIEGLEERAVRLKLHEAKLKTHARDFFRYLYTPDGGPAAGRVSEVEHGEDAELAEAVYIADALGQPWVRETIDLKLAYRVSWGRRGRTEATSILQPPFSPPPAVRRRGFFARLLGMGTR